MAARWLVVKVMDEDLFETFYKINQQRGVDCIEVAAGRLNKAITDEFEIDPNATWLQDNTKEGQT